MIDNIFELVLLVKVKFIIPYIFSYRVGLIAHEGIPFIFLSDEIGNIPIFIQ